VVDVVENPEVPMSRPLLMIPGPIEISERVYQATCVRPPSHVSPALIDDFSRALASMRRVWLAPDDAQPFVVAGGGTLAMESVASNLVAPEEHVVVVETGYFGERMAEMLKRRGAEVHLVGASPGGIPALSEVESVLRAHRVKALFATHVDTSTGVLAPPEPLARLAAEYGALSVFDGVCATGAERFDQGAWGADVYLTASQKAIGLPAGLGLWVASPRAMAARESLKTPPPLTLDWNAWTPIMKAYEARRPSYFATPATTLIPALAVALDELLADGMEAVFRRHQLAAAAMRAGWEALGLGMIPATSPACTLSAVRFPAGFDASSGIVPRVHARGVIVAGGLHPAIKSTYFRVGHMGEVTRRPSDLVRTVRAVGEALVESGAHVDVEAACEATESVLGSA